VATPPIGSARGTGVDADGLARKIGAVARAVARAGGPGLDPLEVLRRVGGREIAAIAGAILAARLQRIPVLLDGYVVTAAAADPARARPDQPRPLPRRATARPSRRTAVRWSESASGRCCRSACGWARAPARRSPAASSGALAIHAGHGDLRGGRRA
jgi:hypothetical protein